MTWQILTFSRWLKHLLKINKRSFFLTFIHYLNRGVIVSSPSPILRVAERSLCCCACCCIGYGEVLIC